MKALAFTLKAWPLVALATIGLCYLTQAVAGWFGVDLPDQANIAFVKGHAGWNVKFAFICAQVAILMPVAEEIVFRWLLWRATKPGRPILAAAISAALFAAAHYLAQPWPDAAFLALFVFGLAQCWIYSWTNHLWCAMLNHALFNVTNLVLLFVLPAA